MIRLTHHARTRCREMGVDYAAPEWIIRNASLTRGDGRGNTVAEAEGSRYAVVYADDGDDQVVITVLFNARDFEARQGRTYSKITQQRSKVS